MKLPRIAGFAAGLMMVLAWAGCGDTFRPVANPISPPGGDPQNTQLALVMFQGLPTPSSGLCADGTAPPCVGGTTQIDVPGDTNIGNFVIGRTPVYGTMVTLVQAVIANRDDNSISIYTPLFPSAAVTTVSLPSGSAPVYLGTAAGLVYVADFGTDSVSIIAPSNQSVIKTISVGHHPVAIASTPDGKKVYVANRDANSVSVISTIDNTVLTTIPVSGSPVYLTSNPNGTAIYALDRAANTVNIIDPATDTIKGQLTVEGGVPASCSANVRLCGFMMFENHLQRLYVPNPGAGTMSIFDATTTGTPTLLKSLAVGPVPTTLAPLSDGSRVYVVNSGTTTGCSGEPDSGQVTIVDTSNNSVRNCVTVGKSPIWIAASPDSTKVYVPHQGATLNPDGTVATAIGTSIIGTSSEKVIINIPAPFSDPNCTVESATCVRETPVFTITNQ